jgi:predicted ATPase
MHQGLAAWWATGSRIGPSVWLTLLAEASGQSGQTEAGPQLLAEALAHVDHTGEGHYEAEVYRIKGELLLNAECGVRKMLPLAAFSAPIGALPSAHPVAEDTWPSPDETRAPGAWPSANTGCPSSLPPSPPPCWRGVGVSAACSVLYGAKQLP